LACEELVVVVVRQRLVGGVRQLRLDQRLAVWWICRPPAAVSRSKKERKVNVT
jgi:hypothetical protein